MDLLVAMKRFPRALGAGLAAFFAGVRRAAGARTSVTQTREQPASRRIRMIDQTKTLEERNSKLIESHLKKVGVGYPNYSVEEGVRECIQEIALAEGNSLMADHVYLSDWSQKASPEYRTLQESLLTRFRAAHELLNFKSQQTKRQSEIDKQVENLKVRYADLIGQFHEIAERKVSLLDDYGDENWDALPKETWILIGKIAKREGKTDGAIKDWKKSDFRMPEAYSLLYNFLESSFKDYHRDQGKRPSGEAKPKMSGTDFERFLVKLLRDTGFSDITGTPASGDQGADLIAKRNGRRIIIQAKCYEGSVGNKAVQEVASALKFYGGDEAWVMTNSTFTKSARELAQKTGVKLFEGRDLVNFAETQGKSEPRGF